MDVYDTGTCDSADGSCEYPIKQYGSTCSDGLSCTLSDICQIDGSCRGTTDGNWYQQASISYAESSGGGWATEQSATWTVDRNIAGIRVTGSSNDGGYCFAYWGTDHIVRYRHSGTQGFDSVSGVWLPDVDGNTCVIPPRFTDTGDVRLCQLTNQAGGFAYGAGTLDTTTPNIISQGTLIEIRARHVKGVGSDNVICNLEVKCGAGY